MIWDDGDDELLDEDGEAPEPTLAHGDDDDAWRPPPPPSPPPLGTGPFEIVAEETRHGGSPVQTTRRVVLATANNYARAYELCQRLNDNEATMGRPRSGVRYYFRAAPSQERM